MTVRTLFSFSSAPASPNTHLSAAYASFTPPRAAYSFILDVLVYATQQHDGFVFVTLEDHLEFVDVAHTHYQQVNLLALVHVGGHLGLCEERDFERKNLQHLYMSACRGIEREGGRTR